MAKPRQHWEKFVIFHKRTENNHKLSKNGAAGKPRPVFSLEKPYVVGNPSIQYQFVVVAEDKGELSLTLVCIVYIILFT